MTMVESRSPSKDHLDSEPARSRFGDGLFSFGMAILVLFVTYRTIPHTQPQWRWLVITMGLLLVVALVLHAFQANVARAAAVRGLYLAVSVLWILAAIVLIATSALEESMVVIDIAMALVIGVVCLGVTFYQRRSRGVER
ncbi:hypothetical protein [Trueperella abortisuis]|uniref:hypothetical protein n=1 Tax=Trueperella abortisuis TaxID=445930 RepID=UPI002893644C|nr:hypothetical protein [Trueperella abortisuis]